MERNDFNKNLIKNIIEPILRILDESKELIPSELTEQETKLMNRLVDVVFEYANVSNKKNIDTQLPQEIKIRNTSAEICDLFEEILDANDINIPSEDRTGEDGEARLYGDVYGELEDNVTNIIANICTNVKNNPHVNINTTEY